MIESRVLYRNDVMGRGEVLVLGTMFKDKFIYTSVVVGRHPQDGMRPSAEVETARDTLQAYSGCVLGRDYSEVAIGTLTAVLVVVHAALQRTLMDQAVLFLAATAQIRKAALSTLMGPG